MVATFDLNVIALVQEQFGEKITWAFCIDTYFELKLALYDPRYRAVVARP